MLDVMKKYFLEEVKYIELDGGMFIWVEFFESINVDDLLDKVIDVGVVYVFGEFFFVNNGLKNIMRFNYIIMLEE